MREIRPGVWRLTVSDGPGPDGAIRRRHVTVHGAEADAAERLAELAETTHGPTRLGDMQVRELVDRYLTWLDNDGDDRNAPRLRGLVQDVVEPGVGRVYRGAPRRRHRQATSRDRHQVGAPATARRRP